MHSLRQTARLPGQAAVLGAAFLALFFPVSAAAGGPLVTLSGQETKARLPILANDEAWRRLPQAPETPQPLPAWARMLAAKWPATTARMLELDAMHRSGDRLDARLRALARWAAADANQCPYAKAVARADWRRAGFVNQDLAALAARPEGLPPLDRAAVRFARKMMREAHAVTDAEVKELVELAGEERVMALVALLAHASFQDRVFLALGVQDEPLPPILVTFGRGSPSKAPVPDTRAGTAPLPPAAGATPPATWLELQQGLEKQKVRGGRIRVPTREEVVRRIGEKHPALWQADILWSRVAYGYQPELTDAWFACTGAFGQEAPMNRVFASSLFWVVTHSVQCFY